MALAWRVAWIIGASTGIGAEIARQLAEAGVIIAASSRNINPTPGLHTFPLDVTDFTAVAACLAAIEKDIGFPDLILVASGTYKAIPSLDLTLDDHAKGNAVNYMGVVHVLMAALPGLKQRKSGHIAWISSVAGYRGLPKSAAYGPTKAALINLAEGLQPELKKIGVGISVINPGFVRTPMTKDNDFPMPFLMEPDEAARRTIKGLARGQFEIAYPWRFVMILKTLRILPYWLFFRLTKGLAS